MNSSTPGLPVHHQLPEFPQTHVHGVGDAIQPSHPLSPLLLLPSVFPSIKVFSDELAFHIRWSKHLPSLGSKEAEHPYCQRRSCGNSNKTLPPFPHSERILLAGAKEETRTPIPAQCNEKHPHRCQRRLTNFLTNLAVTRYLSLLLMGSANENQAKQKVPIRCSVIT